MLSGLFITPLAGSLLDYSHHSAGISGVQHYTLENYTFALSIIPISLLICLVLMAFVKEPLLAADTESVMADDKLSELSS
jgi:hypothetical protein